MTKLKGDHGVKVGLPQGSNDYPATGESVINVGFWHEFGTKFLPERSWMRSSIRMNLAKYKKAIKRGLLDIQKKRLTSDRFLGRLGLVARDDMRAMIDALPLVDTGHLKQSLTWEVLK
ncbi:MAG: hypothetical protein V3V08_05485 [Nannocystaceae bacterium]